MATAKAVGDYLFEGWRVESGYNHHRHVQAWEVLWYETEELGNDLKLQSWVWALTRKRLAHNLIWVCQSIEDATRYGPREDVERVQFPPCSVIIAEDGDGGCLVLEGE